MKIYFDTCALNRLTDDPSQLRIREEADAVTRILDLVTDGELIWTASSVLRLELSQNPDIEGREISLAYMELAAEFVSPQPVIYERANILEAAGFGGFDALHLAIAEIADVEWLFTVDDRFISRASKRGENLQPAVINPLDWVRRRQPWLLKR
jgi:predicted nucleic acid-binding protein